MSFADTDQHNDFLHLLNLPKCIVMQSGKSKQYLFTADVLWKGRDKAVVNFGATEQTISISNPPEFGGIESEGGVEHLFLSAVAGCVMRMYLIFAKKLQFQNIGFECTATGQAEMADDQYRFTYIHLYPKAYISSSDDEAKAQLAMEKARRHCMISNSINAKIIQHPEVVIGKPEAKVLPRTANGKHRNTAADNHENRKK